ncbi:Auxin-responsive protein SAUR40 [Linum grandiflorum]
MEYSYSNSSSTKKKQTNNKISDVVSLQRVLKKWKRLAASAPPPSSSSGKNKKNSSIKFMKRTFSLNDVVSAATVPQKGRVAMSVGEEEKRYEVPTEYLAHQAFRVLLRDAEEEFGFQHDGVLRIPCEVAVFERILKAVRDKTASDDAGEGGSDDELEEEEQCHQFGFPASPVCAGFSSSPSDSDLYGDRRADHFWR